MTVDTVTVAPPPQSKTHRQENFPVASWLIAPALRPHVIRYYNFARMADDIADDPALAAREKRERLVAVGEALAGRTADCTGYSTVVALRESFAELGMPIELGSDLLIAFKQDADRTRYATWADLLEYCRYSANPVGRFMMALHGEGHSSLQASDNLCTALQILNHIQDCQADYRELDRVYLPTDWLDEAGCNVSDLSGLCAHPNLRQVLNRMLGGCDALIASAQPWPGQLTNTRLAMEVAVILNLAARLGDRLRRADPLAGKVRLSKLDFVFATAQGIAGTWLNYTANTRLLFR